MAVRVLLFALTSLGAVGAGACGESAPICENQIIHEATSPDGAMKAVLFRRACGGPTGFSAQVSILPVSATESGKGNAFIVDTAGGLAPAAAWGGPDVGLEWTSPNALTLAYASRARVIIAEPSVRGVTISHKIKD
jgi:hypothetical protein